MSDLFRDFDKDEITESYTPESHAIVANGDAFEICQTIPDGSFQLIVSSPPYNLGKEYEKQVKLQKYLDWQDKALAELVRICHDQGSIVWQVGNFVDDGEVFPLDIYFYPIFKKLGLKLRNRIVWHFDYGLHASKRFLGCYEVLFWFTKSDDYVFNLDPVRIPSKYPGKRHDKCDKKRRLGDNPLGKNPSDYWDLIVQKWETGIVDILNVKSNHPEKNIHPCQFPIELIERCVLALTNEHDAVLDPLVALVQLSSPH